MGNTSSCCSCSPSQVDYQNFISNMDSVKEMSQIEALISHIDELLIAIDTERQVAQPSQASQASQVGSSINSGGGLLEELLKRSKHICKRDIMPNLNHETCKLIIDVTNQATHIQYLGVAFSIVAFVLERIDQVSSNRNECIQLLKYMCNLAKYIKELNEHLAQEKLNRTLQFIVKGCLMCISQMESHALSKFFAAPVAAEDLQKFQRELGHEYQELSLEAIMAVLNRIPVVLPPSQGRDPQAVGIENAENSVIELLDMTSKSVRAVVIYGQGGIGKTTLATAVFSKLDLKNYKYCRVIMEQNCSEENLKLLQQQILRDLYDTKNIDLRDLHEGREKLSENFKKHSSQPVFIFLDNALKESDLEKLIPISSLAFLPEQSRILVTTRNLNESHIILHAGIELHSYPVASLPEEEAQKLFCEFALGSGQESFDPTIDIQGLLRICQGVPLVLKIAGAKLRAQAQSVQACRDTVEYLKSWLLQGGEDELSERMVDFVYNRLEASCKEAFLDIVFFFCNWEQDIVAFSVGEVEFQELQRAALVNITDEGYVNVHDIVEARGRMLSPDGERITDLQSLTDVLQDTERIKKTKGIDLSEEFEPETFELEACHLNRMKRCLRVLILGKSTRIVNGECKGAFENLRFLRLDNHNYSLMDVCKHPKLAVFIGDFYEYEFCEFSGVASSLKYMHINGAILVNLTTTLSQLQSLRSLTLGDCRGFDSLPETIGNLPSLEKLDFEQCSTLTSLPHSFGNLSSLKELNFKGCSSLLSLQDNFGNLSSLEMLNLSYCSSLVSLPDSFVNLSSLKDFNFEYCSSLVSLSLPDSFVNLSSLNKLNLTNCTSLVSLPDNFGNLSSLKELEFKYCSSLVSLPDSFGNLSSLKELDLNNCSSLINLSNNFGNLSSLVTLYLDSCTQLSVLPESFRNLASVKLLILGKCKKLSNLPQNFGQLKCLKYVSIHGCSVLQTLSADFECLSSLIAIKASECPQLEEYTMDKLAKMKGLMIVDIDGSPMLEKRWEQVKEQYSLAVVVKQESWYDQFSYADVMSRAFFHSESKFVHLYENGQFEESPCLTDGVKLYFLLMARDLTSPSNSSCLEAMKKKWMEVAASEGGQMMMIIVEMGGSWEESETRVRQALRHLPSGTRAWIAPDNRARLWFALSMCSYHLHSYQTLFRREEKAAHWNVQNCIVSTSISVDEDGRRKLHDFDFIIPDHAPDFGGRDTFQELLSPILEAQELLLCGDGDEDAKRVWMLNEMRTFMIRRRLWMMEEMIERLTDGDGFQ